MALREITRDETASWHQSMLTADNEDQKHKGGAASSAPDMEEDGGGSDEGDEADLHDDA